MAAFTWESDMSGKWRIWNGERLPGEWLGIDTETENIVTGQVPPLVVLSACGSDHLPVVCGRHNAVDFLRLHADRSWIMHNAPFDFEVITKFITETTGTDVTQWMCARVDQNKIWATDIAYRLLELATVGSVPYRWALSVVAQQELGIEMYKGDDVRMNWDASIPLHEWSDDRLKYAADDALITLLLWEKLYPRLEKYHNHLSHKIQLGKHLALSDIERRGMGFDQGARETFLTAIDAEISDHVATLASYGYTKGIKGNQKVLQAQLVAFEDALGLTGDMKLPRTTKGISSSAKEISEKLEEMGLEDARGFPFIHAYSSFQQLSKFGSFVEKHETDRVHPRFDWLMRTGRTSCRNPNLQNLPRKPGVRECFVPSKGKWLITCDYSTVELATLAQSCYTRFGFSAMRDAINAGQDLHNAFAAEFYAIEMAAVDGDQRQFAKAPNFGFPGGLGPRTFTTWAKQTYGVNQTLEEASHTREVWQNKWPEMVLHLADGDCGYNFIEGPFDKPEINKAVALRVIGGAVTSKAGKPYKQAWLNWVYHEVMPALGVKEIGWKSMKTALSETAQLSTGLVRAKASYCARRNFEFQGLAAAGASIALWEAYKAGLQVVNFVHDELIVEVDPHEAAAVGQYLSDLMIAAMRMVCPDVLINTEWAAMTRWYKGAAPMWLDGQLLACDGPSAFVRCPTCGKPTTRWVAADGGSRLHTCKKCKVSLKV